MIRICLSVTLGRGAPSHRLAQSPARGAVPGRARCPADAVQSARPGTADVIGYGAVYPGRSRPLPSSRSTAGALRRAMGRCGGQRGRNGALSFRCHSAGAALADPSPPFRPGAVPDGPVRYPPLRVRCGAWPAKACRRRRSRWPRIHRVDAGVAIRSHFEVAPLSGLYSPSAEACGPIVEKASESSQVACARPGSLPGRGDRRYMPSDRSTLQRGVPGGDQSAWQEPTAPGGRRLPSAPRERKPALAALAVLLILGCALGTGFLVIQSGKRVAAIEISQEVGAGQRIPATAMQEVQIASNSGLSYVPWNQATQVARFYAASPIPAGTLLTNAMVASSTTSTAGPGRGGPGAQGRAAAAGPAGRPAHRHLRGQRLHRVMSRTLGTTLAANAIVIAIDTPEINSGYLGHGGRRGGAGSRGRRGGGVQRSNGIVGIAVLPNGGRGAGVASPGGAPAAPSRVRGPAAARRPAAARPSTRPPAATPGRRRPAMGRTDPWR